MQEEIDKLKEEVRGLKDKLEQMDKRQRDVTELQDDFSGIQVIKRKVKFIDEVYNRAGTKVIN